MQNSIKVQTCPEPFSFKRVDWIVEEDQTIEQILEKCSPVLLRDDVYARVFVNDQIIAKDYWSSIRPKHGDIVNIRILPQGGEGKDPTRTMLTLLVLAAAAYAGPAAAGALNLTEVVGGKVILTTAGSIVSAGVSTAVTVVGMLAVNALVPPPVGNLGGEGDQFKRSPTLTGGQNKANPYGPIPVILGMHRIVPPYGAMPYTEIIGDDQYLRMLFVIGYGPLKLGNFKFGDTDISDLEDVEMEIREGYDSDEPITLYTQNVRETQLNIELSYATGYVTQTTEENCDEISVDISFLQGLFKIESDGTKSSTSVDFEIQYSIKDADDWSVGVDYESISAQESDSMPATGFDHVYRYYRVVINKYTGEISTLAGNTGGDPSSYHSYHSQYFPAAVPPTVPDWACPIAKILRNNSSTISASDITDERDSCLKKQNAGDFAPSAQSPESDKIDIAAGYLKVDPSFSDARADIIRRTFRFKVPRGQYDVRIKRLTADSGDDTVDTAHWTALRSITNEDPISSDENLALVALRVKATDQLSGTLNQFNCTAMSVVKDWDSASSTWIERESANPASLFRHVLQSSANKQALADSRINLTDLQEWHEDCITTPQNLDNAAAIDKGNGLVGIPCTGHGYADGALIHIFGTVNYDGFYVLDDSTSADIMVIEATYAAENFTGNETVSGLSYSFNAVIDYQTSVEQILREIASAGRASLSYVDGKFSIVQDKEQLTPVQHFSPRNSWGYQGEKQFSQMPHAFRVQFINEAKEWRADEILVYDDGYDANNATIFETLSLRGITNSEMAYKHARYFLACARLRPEIHSFYADVENIICTRGDLIRFTHDVPMFGVASGRVASITEDGGGNLTHITMDSEVGMEAGKDYAIRIRKSDGSSSVYNIVTNPGYQTVLELETPASSGHNVQADDLGLFGEEGSESVELIVKSIEPAQDLTARIVCVDYNSAIYSADTGSIPEFDSQITLPYDIFETIGSPIVDNIRSDTYVHSREEDGALAYRILVSFRYESGHLFDQVAKMESAIRLQNSEGPWIYNSYSGFQSEIAIDGVQGGESYDLKFRYVALDGSIGPWCDVETHTVIGKDESPAKPSDVSATGIINAIRLDWTNPPDLDFDHVNIWRNTSDSFPGGDALYSVAGSPNGSVSATDKNVSYGTTYFYFLKAVDAAGNLSEATSSVNASPKQIETEDLTDDLIPPLPSDENLVAYWAFDEGSGTSAIDSSGNGLNLLFHSMSNASWKDGISGKCIQFDGSEDYATVNHNGSLDFAGKDLTVSVWMYHNGSGDFQSLVANAVGQSSTRQFSLGLNSSNQLLFYTYDGTSWAKRVDSGSNLVSAGSWHHVVVVFDDTAGTAELFIDGENVGSASGLNSLAYSPTYIYVGSREGYEYLNGKIDEVRLYEEAITSDEVRALFLNPGGQKPQWTAEPGATATAPDNLVLNGGAELGGTLNFSQFEYVANDGYQGLGCFSVTGSNNTRYSDAYIPVSVDLKYEIQAAIKASSTQKTYMGFAGYDENKTLIYHQHCWRHANRDTTLYAQANQGDTYVDIVPPSEDWTGTYSTIQFDIESDYSDLPNFNTRFIDSIDKSNDPTYWRVNLQSGQTVPATYAAGTKVGHTQAGAAYSYILLTNQDVSTDWEFHSDIIDGVNSVTSPPGFTKFRYGTKYIRFLALTNRTSSATTYIDSVSIRPLGKKLSDIEEGADVTANNPQSSSWLTDQASLIFENDSITRLIDRTLDNIADGATYGRVLLTDISSGHILLASCTGSLDDINDGSTYGRVLATDISAGHIKLSEAVGDLDDIADGTYGKVLSTDISAGHIVLSSVVGDADDIAEGTTNKFAAESGADVTANNPQSSSWLTDQSNIVFANDSITRLIDRTLDYIDDGATYGRILLSDISSGHILLASCEGTLDDIDDGTTYGKVLATDISAGHIKLSEAVGDLDDIADGTYGKVLSTDISAGHIILSSVVGDADDISEGTTNKFAAESGADVTPPLPSDEHLVAYWSFDDGTGTTAIDNSGNGHDGTLVNMEEADWVSGVSGNALSFDGTNKQVTIPSDSSFSFERTDSFSICLWCKRNAYGGILLRKSAGNYTTPGYGIQDLDGENQFRVYLSGTTNGNDLIKDFNYPQGYIDQNWGFLVITYDGSVSFDGLLLYWNGDEISGDNVRNTLTETTVTTDPLQITNGGFDGLIDEVRIYNKVLTASEIKALYLNPAGVSSRLAENRIYTGLDSDGNLQTKVLPGENVGTPAGAGLYLGADHMGYFNGSAWTNYIDSDGSFKLGKDSNNYFAYDLATFKFKFSDADALEILGGGNIKLNGGDIILSTGGGSVRGGQTDFATGIGFFLGYSGSDYKFSVGNSTKYLKWDGNDLQVGGDIIATGNIKTHAVTQDKLEPYEAGDVSLHYDDYVHDVQSTTYTKAKELRIPRGGELRITFSISMSNATRAYGRIYRNGSPVGTERSTTWTPPDYESFTEDISGWSPGDLVQIYIRGQDAPGSAYAKVFSVSVDNSFGVDILMQ